MNTSKDSLDDDQDPEYESSVPNDETKQKAFEESARATTAKKIVDIVEKEFTKEIDQKEKEVLQIQNRLDEALRILHLLRYAVVTDFYNRKQCQASHINDSKQTRIHPAVKKLLGKSPRVLKKSQFIDVAIPSTSTDPRFLIPDAIPSTSKITPEKSIENVNLENSSKEENVKRPHSESSENEPPKKIPRYVPPKNAIPEAPGPSRGHRNKIRKRIIVGNISKWIPPEWREDKTSHKWTVYVRGSKEEADIGGYVAKVRFLLDPSYRPNDVVEVSSSPFHLSRRGWGEFPLRVQLHFKNSLNKPIDIIHPLKLDRTFTGLQTLGAETVVDIWLQTSEPRPATNSTTDNSENNKLNFNTNGTTGEEITLEKSDQESNLTITHESPKDEISQLKLISLIDHDYCKLSKSSLSIESNKTLVHLRNGSLNSDTRISLNGLQTNSILNTNSVEKLANTLKDTPGKMQPLQISIPDAFESTTKNQILVLKNKDFVPVKFDPKSKVLIDPISIQKKVNNNLNKGEVGKISEKPKVIKINPVNSILLTANYSEPALRIVDPMNSVNENKIVRSFDLRVGSNSSKSDVNLQNNTKTTKPKVILGKIKMNKEIHDEIMRSIDDVRLTDTLSIVQFIIHRLPLITEKVSDPEYRKLYPFSCGSIKEFLSYNIGKQRAFEWQRARAVRSFLKRKVTAEEVWSVKEIIIWARRHAYTPMSSIFHFENTLVDNMKKSSNSDSIFSTYSKPVDLHKWLSESSKINDENNCEESDEEIDVLFESKPNEVIKIENDETLSDADVLEIPVESESLFIYVNETARNIGIKLTDEEIIPGVRHCSGSHAMMRAVECFVDNILRLSHATALEKLEDKNSYVETLNLEDVKRALLKREEFDLFTNAGLGNMSIEEE